MLKSEINVSQIRTLAGQYAAGELHACIRQALDTGASSCLLIVDQAEAISLLSMAGFVRARMEQDAISVSQALRILGRKMRSLTKGP